MKKDPLEYIRLSPDRLETLASFIWREIQDTVHHVVSQEAIPRHFGDDFTPEQTLIMSLILQKMLGHLCTSVGPRPLKKLISAHLAKQAETSLFPEPHYPVRDHWMSSEMLRERDG
ncbi:hypothetical protein [Pseudomonas sp. 18173]|uniref:hypothetical protein n=1 Tax=Pseudomonas sp. 18173 TaxID=3390055 RepID=UPI003D21689B